MRALLSPGPLPAAPGAHQRCASRPQLQGALPGAKGSFKSKELGVKLFRLGDLNCSALFRCLPGLAAAGDPGGGGTMGWASGGWLGAPVSPHQTP